MAKYAVTFPDGETKTFSSKMNFTHIVAVTYPNGVNSVYKKATTVAHAEKALPGVQTYMEKFFAGATVCILPLTAL